MHQTRRKVLIGAASLATVSVGSSLVMGEDSKQSWVVTEVNEEREYVIFTNTSGSEVDVSGAVVAFEYGNEEYDQRRPIPDGTSVQGGGQLMVFTGAKEDHSSGTAGITDVSLGYDGEVLNNDGNDVVALLSPDESEVWCRSDDEMETTTTTTTSEESTTTTTTDDESTDDETTTTTDGSSGGSDDSNGSGSSDESDETTDESSDGSSSDESSDDDC